MRTKYQFEEEKDAEYRRQQEISEMEMYELLVDKTRSGSTKSLVTPTIALLPLPTDKQIIDRSVISVDSQPDWMSALDRLMQSEEGVSTDALQTFTGKQIRMWMNTQTLKYNAADCPVCRSHVQSYRRTISLSQVYWMILLNKITKGGQKYVDFKVVSTRLYEALNRNASDHPLLRHWGLVESSPVSQGEYTITRKGIDFIEGKISVPKYLYFNNNRIYKQSQETIKFDDSKNFDLLDLKKL